MKNRIYAVEEFAWDDGYLWMGFVDRADAVDYIARRAAERWEHAWTERIGLPLSRLVEKVHDILIDQNKLTIETEGLYLAAHERKTLPVCQWEIFDMPLNMAGENAKKK